MHYGYGYRECNDREQVMGSHGYGERNVRREQVMGSHGYGERNDREQVMDLMAMESAMIEGNK